MEFEWSEKKNQINKKRHGIDFVDAQALFETEPVYHYHSPRDGEDRWVTVGRLADRFFLVVWTWRGERVRIISAHRADERHIRRYRELFG
ncbi:BrnT family toxin [Rhodobacteraceae bacterium CCMM004]|nr:BrnT family toxin [Rhodobacteraceae bacterium CCMM004]